MCRGGNRLTRKLPDGLALREASLGGLSWWSSFPEQATGKRAAALTRRDGAALRTRPRLRREKERRAERPLEQSPAVTFTNGKHFKVPFVAQVFTASSPLSALPLEQGPRGPSPQTFKVPATPFLKGKGVSRVTRCAHSQVALWGPGALGIPAQKASCLLPALLQGLWVHTRA